MKRGLRSLALAAGLILSACQGKTVEGTASLPLVKRDFEHVLGAEGAVVPVVQETLEIPQRSWGTLEMLLPEGTEVKKGMVVARVSTRQAAERMAQYAERMDAEQAELMKQRAEMPLERIKQQAEVKTKEREAKVAQLDLQTTREGPRTDERVRAEVAREVPALRQSAYPLAEKEALYAKGYLSEQELNQARLEFARIETERETAELSLEQQTQAYRKPEIRAAELKAQGARLDARIGKLQADAQAGLQRTRTRNQGSRVQSFQRRIGNFQARLAGSELRAPFDGVLLYPLLWGSETPYVGMEVWGGLPVAQVAKTAQLRIEARVNEFDIPHVKPGLPVDMTSPAFPGKVFAGKVSKVQKLAKFKDEKKPVGLKYFDVTIELARPAPELKANMTLQTAIKVGTLKQVWTVPLESLIAKESTQAEQAGTTYTLRIEQDGKISEKPVEVLARSRDFAAVKGNLSGSERVLLAGAE